MMFWMLPGRGTIPAEVEIVALAAPEAKGEAAQQSRVAFGTVGRKGTQGLVAASNRIHDGSRMSSSSSLGLRNLSKTTQFKRFVFLGFVFFRDAQLQLRFLVTSWSIIFFIFLKGPKVDR